MAQRQFRSDDTEKWDERMGKGLDGSKVVSVNTTFAAPNEGCSGTISTKSVTLAAAGGFANDDLVLIHQSRGTSVGVWELNKIVSGGGGTSLTMKYDLTNTYADSGASQAQMIKLLQYTDLTVNTGITWSAPTWDGSKGGIIAYLCNGETNIIGTIDSSAKTFVGGSGSPAKPGYQGEGTAGAGGTQSNAANGNGGGGGSVGAANGGGGGGGNGLAGGLGSGVSGVVGAAVGNASLTIADFGGGGGSGGSGTSIGAGGVGGGLLAIISKSITGTGTIITDGGAAPAGGFEAGGGGGAGGSNLFKAEDADFSSLTITSVGGTGAVGSLETGGVGAVGRNHLDYSKSVSGTTVPTLDSTQDSTILASNPGAMFLLL